MQIIACYNHKKICAEADIIKLSKFVVVLITVFADENVK